MSRDKKNCNKVAFRNSLFYLSKSKVGEWSGNELSCPNNRQNFFLQVFHFLQVNKKEKAKMLGEGEMRQESVCEFLHCSFFDGVNSI